ncbi:hypothetical protein [Streptomyces neyagawaensis]|uniref:Uncharacterized protein n=1 Tax=Streptomyces neyagawaensis TaxID=42238 RepID=A0ABV3AUF2_9ACTN
MNSDFGSAAAAISIAERARALRWLQANANDFLDFGVLEAKEQATFRRPQTRVGHVINGAEQRCAPPR